MQTIEETYRLTDQDGRELGLFSISSTLTQGGELDAHAVTVSPIDGRSIPAGAFRAHFVKREASADLYRRIRRGSGPTANDPRRPL